MILKSLQQTCEIGIQLKKKLTMLFMVQFYSLQINLSQCPIFKNSTSCHSSLKIDIQMKILMLSIITI